MDEKTIYQPCKSHDQCGGLDICYHGKCRCDQNTFLEARPLREQKKQGHSHRPEDEEGDIARGNFGERLRWIWLREGSPEITGES
ncbi:hypothetical protein QR680_018843 [Steinernema hermaphroditum]|uniref:EB domain-containing protein n=1 Tax=Steinernema hermaphroditum TaxID=289476 RepID=A0AA39LRQ0_9BILA|nr:hypothetical protein QR680_018843 [Steinernema hermaphroditum]